MIDVVIIGAGPAGLSAAIYAKRAGLNVVVIDKSGAGGQILSTYEVDNYPGLKGISGMELGSKMHEHAKSFDVMFKETNVRDIDFSGETICVVTDEETITTKNIILATGASHRKLGVKGEDELVSAGVSYCATCDGAFYKGAVVAVVGGGDVALEDALFLARTSEKVYLIHRREEFRGAKVLQEAVKRTPNIEILYDTVVEELMGADEGELTGVIVKNVKSGFETRLDVEGVFVAVGIQPNSENFAKYVETDENGYVLAGEDCRTSRKSVYVAGDLRTKPLRQVVTAVADGANAVKSLEEDML